MKLQDTKFICRDLLHLYVLTMNYHKEKLKEQSYLPSHQKKKKHLGINLSKAVKDLYSENCDTNERKMIQTDGKIFHGLGLGASTVLKWSNYLRQSTDSVQSLSKYQWLFFHRGRTNNFKICMEIWILTEIWFIYVSTSAKLYYVNQRSCQPLHLTKFFLWLLILPMRILKFRDQKKKKKKGKKLVTEWRLELWSQI